MKCPACTKQKKADNCIQCFLQEQKDRRRDIGRLVKQGQALLLALKSREKARFEEIRRICTQTATYDVPGRVLDYLDSLERTDKPAEAP